MKLIVRILAAWCVLFIYSVDVIAQSKEDWSSALDSARAKEDGKKDSVILSAKYIRYATLDMLKKATYTRQIDTSHHNYQYYNPQNLPWNPSVNLGSYGLATRDLLFQPKKTIGFQSGFTALERYLLNPDSIQYFRARARYSELSAVGFFFNDQVFRARVAQNINSQWNMNVDFHSTKTDGYYLNQNYSDLKASVASWYESKNNRYNLLINAVFNRLDAMENGSITEDLPFAPGNRQAPDRFMPKFNSSDKNTIPRSKWWDNSFFLRQSLYLGRLDTIDKGKPTMEIRPTNSMAHNTRIRRQTYNFFKNMDDLNAVLPYNNKALALNNDKTLITNVSNEFEYNFFLRGKSVFKNEAKLNVAFQHDMNWVEQNQLDSNRYYNNRAAYPQPLKKLPDSTTFNRFYQNGILKGELGYKFSDRLDFSLRANQIVFGHNFGDFLYDAKVDIAMGDKIGKVTLSAYSQNKSPEMVFENLNYTYGKWNDLDLKKTKIQNLGFQYANPMLGFHGKVEYFLMNNYTYFEERPNPQDDPKNDKWIVPTQLGKANLLKVTVGQKFKLNHFTLDNLVVYQKTDQQDVLAVPELYTWHSLYYSNLFYKVIDYSIGLDAKFNTPYANPNYSVGTGQFYNAIKQIEFSTYPVMDLWITANIQRVNMFLSYNFLNQNFYPHGYYTVRRYPMNTANFRFGISWKFYD
ncbi:putative porin [Sphingobacterium sp.]|uniref:putative porin n=1 Tax=Sphingobacterium sp. TaxID=341027 RepID=UPI0028B136F6|nr:putative porin [Sphingobacterium sp.]